MINHVHVTFWPQLYICSHRLTLLSSSTPLLDDGQHSWYSYYDKVFLWKFQMGLSFKVGSSWIMYQIEAIMMMENTDLIGASRCCGRRKFCGLKNAAYCKSKILLFTLTKGGIVVSFCRKGLHITSQHTFAQIIIDILPEECHHLTHYLCMILPKTI